MQIRVLCLYIFYIHTQKLNEAIAQGCDLVTASTLPGSGSQRNYERLGFVVAYTKVTLVG